MNKLQERLEYEEWIGKLAQISDPAVAFQFRVYQYLVKAVKKDHIDELIRVVIGLGEDVRERVADVGSMLVNNALLLEDTHNLLYSSTKFVVNGLGPK